MQFGPVDVDFINNLFTFDTISYFIFIIIILHVIIMNKDCCT